MGIVDILFYLAMYLSLFVSIFWFTIIFNPDKKKITKKAKMDLITIIVPAYNKARTIERCLLSLIMQSYPINVIVVDDGSTDNTRNIINGFVKKYKNIKYIRKENGGKASALNLGLKYVKTKHFGFLDADTFLKENSLEKMMPYFRRNVASVTTTIKADKPRNIIEKIQKIEYIMASFTRKLLSFRNSLYYTPGFAIYKTKIIKNLGGFDEKNITEDLEIGLRLKSNGYEIENSIESYVHTEVPKSVKDLINQRIRWYRGHIHNTRKYSNMFFNKRFGDLGIFVLPVQYVLLVMTSLLLLYGLYSVANSVTTFFIDLYIINFDASYIISNFNMNLITSTTFFWVILFSAFTLMIRISEKRIDEKINIAEYIMYIFLYPFLNLALWLGAFFLEVIKAKRKW